MTLYLRKRPWSLHRAFLFLNTYIDGTSQRKTTIIQTQHTCTEDADISTMDYIPTVAKERLLETLTLVMTFSRQFDFDPWVSYTFLLLVSLMATSVLLWVLTYLRILIFIGLLLCGSKVGVKYLKAEWPALASNDGQAAAKVEGETRNRIKGLEELEGGMRQAIEDDRERREVE